MCLILGSFFYEISFSSITYHFFYQKNNEENLIENYNLFIDSNIDQADYPKKWLRFKNNNDRFLVSSEKNKYATGKLVNIINKEIVKIPKSVMKKNINTVYVLEKLKPNGISIGGTYSIGKKSLYISTRSKDNFVIGNDFIAKIFHHEISSVLMKNYGFMNILWKDCHGDNFLYKSEENPFYYLVYIQGNADLVEEMDLLRRGLLNQYSETGIENDFNTYAEVVFTEPKKMKKLIAKYPVIQRKYEVFKSFYLGIDEGFAPVFSQIDN